eukprot:scaffold124633_cov60-Phaeocystis_antarctica.AAC.2
MGYAQARDHRSYTHTLLPHPCTMAPGSALASPQPPPRYPRPARSARSRRRSRRRSPPRRRSLPPAAAGPGTSPAASGPAAPWQPLPPDLPPDLPPPPPLPRVAPPAYTRRATGCPAPSCAPA